MKTKKIYNPPITEMVEVEFEGGFMAGSGDSAVNEETKVNTNAQDVNDYSNNVFGADNWQNNTEGL